MQRLQGKAEGDSQLLQDMHDRLQQVIVIVTIVIVVTNGFDCSQLPCSEPHGSGRDDDASVCIVVVV